VDTVPEIREILVVLSHRYAFRELAYLIGVGATGVALGQREVARVQQLCAYGERLLDLDGEDLARRDSATGSSTDATIAEIVSGELVPAYLVERGRLCHIRQAASSGLHPADALDSLRPAYRLLLEVIAARWQRRETASLVAAAHIAAEYAPLLAWQRVLGHAGDPAQLAADPAFAGPGSRWGDLDAPDCPHTKRDSSAARRAMRVALEPPSGWQSYLDRQHSTVSHAMGFCATSCPTPCSVLTSRSDADRTLLGEACRLAGAFAHCGLVRLRHAAPVGHGFGVPSPHEVAEAWQRSRDGIAGRGGLGVAVTIEDGYPLPGLPSLFSAIAGVELTADTLLADTAAEITSELDPAHEVHWPLPA
jgi:hypothetical protein